MLLIAICTLLIFLGSCKTVSGPKPNSNCSFPFQFGDITYNSCTKILNTYNDTKAWCSVMVDNSGKHVVGEWGYCEPSCQPDWCLTDENKCIGTRRHDPTYHISFCARTEASCTFPFKRSFKDEILHRSCTRKNREYSNGPLESTPWCATSVDENLKMKTWGYCSESCLNEDIAWSNKDSSTVSIVIISITILIVSAIIMIYCCYIKRNKQKEENYVGERGPQDINSRHSN